MENQPQTEARPRIHWFLLLAAVFFVVFILIAAVLFIHSASGLQNKNVVTMKDGSILEFVDVVEGGKEFTTAKPWAKTIAKILPKSFAGWLPGSMTMAGTGYSNELSVWWRLTGNTGAFSSIFRGQSYSQEINPNGGLGAKFTSDGNYSSIYGTPGITYYAVRLRNYPRRQKSFMFHILDAQGLDLAVFQISNPASRKYPVWESSPMPQAKTNGPVSLTLQGFHMVGTNKNSQFMPQWSVESADPQWQHAKPRSIEYSDATGNTSQLPTLSKAEAAWKISTLVYRERPEDFSAEDTMVITNITFPARDNFFVIDRTNTISGVDVKVEWLCGPGELLISDGVNGKTKKLNTNTVSPVQDTVTTQYLNGPPMANGSSQRYNSTYSFSKPYGLFELKNTLPDDQLQIRFIDESGHKAGSARPPYQDKLQMNATETMEIRIFDLPKETKTLTMEIRLSRPIRFEFLVKPSDVVSQK